MVLGVGLQAELDLACSQYRACSQRPSLNLNISLTRKEAARKTHRLRLCLEADVTAAPLVWNHNPAFNLA